jgi:uncharacterized protein (TIGR02145 family)
MPTNQPKLCILALISLTSFLTLTTIFALFPNPTSAIEDTQSTQVELKINSVIGIAAESCNTTEADYQTNTKISVQPGKQSSQCQNIIVNTNASAGYELSMIASSSNLTHTTITPSPPVIPATSGTITNPIALADTATGTWGFSVPKTQAEANKLYGCFNPNTPTTAPYTTDCPTGSNFDSSYSIEDNQNSSTAKYAAFPTTTTTLAQTDEFPSGTDTYTLYLATRIPNNKPAGQYQTTITYTVVGEELPCEWDSSISWDDVNCVEPEYLAKVVTDNHITTMQELTTAICGTAIYDNTSNGVNQNNTVTLTDTRNNQDYLVGKLADNNCWMLNNLKIANQAIDNTNTDLNTKSSFTIPALDTTNNYDPDNPIVYGPLNSSNSRNGEDYDVSDPTSDHFGGYLYNWSAVTAGATTSNYTNQYDYTDNSICPKNWKLPTANGDWQPDSHPSDFAALNIAMYNNGSGTTSSNYYDQNHANNFKFAGPFRGVFSGDWYGDLNDQGDWANLWSGSAFGSLNAFYLDFYPSGVGPDGVSSRSYGFAVRCLLR